MVREIQRSISFLGILENIITTLNFKGSSVLAHICFYITDGMISVGGVCTKLHYFNQHLLTLLHVIGIGYKA